MKIKIRLKIEVIIFVSLTILGQYFSSHFKRLNGDKKLINLQLRKIIKRMSDMVWYYLVPTPLTKECVFQIPQEQEFSN